MIYLVGEEVRARCVHVVYGVIYLVGEEVRDASGAWRGEM